MKEDDDVLRINSIAAAAHLVQSKRFHAVLIAVGGVAWSAFMAVSGWIGGKLELGSEVAELTVQVRMLTGKVDVLTSQQRDLVQSLNALSAQPSGRLFILDAEMRYVRRDVVRNAAAIYAGESARVREAKSTVADSFGSAYLRLLAQGNTPSAAAETLLSKVAVP